jgi:hypothetical protein
MLETSTWQHTILARGRLLCPPAGFEPAIPASDRAQTHALGCVATGISCNYFLGVWNLISCVTCIEVFRVEMLSMQSRTEGSYTVYRRQRVRSYVMEVDEPLSFEVCRNLIVSIKFWMCQWQIVCILLVDRFRFFIIMLGMSKISRSHS